MNKKLIGIIFISIILVLNITIQADVPSFVSYQGRLADASDEPLNGQFELNFAIFDQAEGGQQKWSENHSSVTVNNGIFAIMLGSVNPLVDSVFSGSERFLEISVNGETISQRTQFSTVSYTYKTGSIDGANGGVVKGSIIMTATGSDLFEDSPAVIDISVNNSNLGEITFYDPVDTKSFGNVESTKTFQLNKNGMIIYDGNGVDTSATFTRDLTGISTVSFYDPVDTRANYFGAGLTSKKFEISKEGLIMFGNTPDDTAISLSQDITGSGTISFYEPVDTYNRGFGETTKKIEMNRSGLYMFGQTIFDTSLIVAPSGDIIGSGQLTMGENSSSGFETSVLGFDNTANGDSSTIGGGSSNITNGANTVIAGGFSNTADGSFSVISGGSNHSTLGHYSSILGGYNNIAEGPYSSILGGSDNYTFGDHSLAAGYKANANHDGSFVWADLTDEIFSSTLENQFLIRASGGVGIGTDSPVGILDVVGTPGDSSVNLPDDAISSPEIFDEPGISSNRQNNPISLPQNIGSMTDIITTSITIPTSGYIMVRGGGTFVASGTNKTNQAIIQIDENSGGGMLSPYYGMVGPGDQDSPSKEHYFSMNVERIYYKTAGTYTFILEAMSNPDNSGSASSSISNSFVTAMFIPTNYGIVEE